MGLDLLGNAFDDKKAAPQGGSWNFSGLLTKALFAFILYLFAIGIVGWSDQIKWILIIVAAIWVLRR